MYSMSMFDRMFSRKFCEFLEDCIFFAFIIFVCFALVCLCLFGAVNVGMIADTYSNPCVC